MTYEEKQQLKGLFTMAFYSKYDKGEVFMKTYDCLTLAHHIIDEYFKRGKSDEEERSD